MSGWAQPGRVARPGPGRWQHGDAYVHDRGWQGGLAGAGATLSPQAAHPRPRPSRACTAVLPTQSRAGPVRAASGGAGSAADPRSPPLVAAPPPRLRLRPAVTGPSTCPPAGSPPRRGASRPPSPPRRARAAAAGHKGAVVAGKTPEPGSCSPPIRLQQVCSTRKTETRAGRGGGAAWPRRGPEESRARGSPLPIPRSSVHAGPHRKCVIVLSVVNILYSGFVKSYL